MNLHLMSYIPLVETIGIDAAITTSMITAGYCLY
jgi:hypothetical protein